MQRARLKISPPRTAAFDAAAYAIEVRRELDGILDLMEKTWGFRPPVTVVAEACVVVAADFNLKGFAHKGRKRYVRASTSATRNRPALVAAAVAAELTDHRNTCKECGEDVMALSHRVYIAERLARGGWISALDDAERCRVPADVVERRLNPRLAARLDAALAALAVLDAPKKEPDEYAI